MAPSYNWYYLGWGREGLGLRRRGVASSSGHLGMTAQQDLTAGCSVVAAERKAWSSCLILRVPQRADIQGIQTLLPQRYINIRVCVVLAVARVLLAPHASLVHSFCAARALNQALAAHLLHTAKHSTVVADSRAIWMSRSTRPNTSTRLSSTVA